MSILTAAPLKVYPPAANSVTVTTGSANGVMGAWVEVIPPETIGAPIYIAGVCAELFVSGLTDGATTEIQFGTGEAGSETSISAPIIVVASAGNLVLEIQMFLVPIGNIPAGARIAMRTRTTSGNVPYKFAVMYYESLDEEPAMVAPYTYAPYSDGASLVGEPVTPSSSAWLNSPWASLISLGAQSALLGVGASYSNSAYDGVEYEIDLGAGDPGSEVVLTTLRGVFSNVGVQGYMDLWLPAMYPIDVDTTISYRLRKANTTTITFRLHLIYIHDIPAPPPPEPFCATIVCPQGYGVVEKTIRRERVAPHLSNDQKNVAYPAIQVELRPGTGHTIPPGVQPQVMLSVSFDGGYNWTPETWMSAGELGDYRKRVIARQLGYGRDVVFKVVVSDPNVWDLLNAYFDPPPIRGRH